VACASTWVERGQPDGPYLQASCASGENCFEAASAPRAFRLTDASRSAGVSCRSLAFDDHPRQQTAATSLVTTGRYALRYAGSENNHAIAKTNRDSPWLTHKLSPDRRIFADFRRVCIRMGIRVTASAFNSIIVLAYVTAVAVSGVRGAFRVGDLAAVHRFVLAAYPTDCSVNPETDATDSYFFCVSFTIHSPPGKNSSVASKSIDR